MGDFDDDDDRLNEAESLRKNVQVKSFEAADLEYYKRIVEKVREILRTMPRSIDDEHIREPSWRGLEAEIRDAVGLRPTDTPFSLPETPGVKFWARRKYGSGKFQFETVVGSEAMYRRIFDGKTMPKADLRYWYTDFEYNKNG